VTEVLLLGGKVGIWKQAREIYIYINKLVIMSEPKSKGDLSLTAGVITQGDISLGLMKTSLRPHLCRVPHGRHISDERKDIRLGNFTFDDRSHQTGDAAFAPNFDL